MNLIDKEIQSIQEKMKDLEIECKDWEDHNKKPNDLLRDEIKSHEDHIKKLRDASRLIA